MATLIANTKLTQHSVDKYNFKSLTHSDAEDTQSIESFKAFTKDNNPNRRESDIDSSAMSKNSKDALIESLMKKTDEMSSNFIKLQMKIEANEEEFELKLKEAQEESFEKGLQEGVQKAIDENNSEMSKGIAQFSTSVITLENSAKEFQTALDGIKSELISAAVDISHEVITVELSENSSAVAVALSEGLIQELQSASEITLKVNPQDHGLVSQKVGLLEHIQIVSDSAVSEGGVIAISDAGNIDSQISKRFQRVKKAALSE